MKNILFLSLWAFIAVPFSSFGFTTLGGEVTYKYIDSAKYEVSVIWYRDCRSVPFPGSTTLNIRCVGSSTTVNQSLSITSITDVTSVCDTATRGCSPANSYGSEGLEQHLYKGIVDFNSSALSGLASCGTKIVFSSSLNSRNTAITTGVSGTAYIFAELDRIKAPTNSSPTLFTNPPLTLCCSQPVRFNIGATDTINSDSLSYAWGQPQSGYGTNISYSSGFAYNNMFTVFDPRPTSGLPPLPDNNPPIGLYINPKTGDIIFTPTSCTQVTVAVVEVTEWRKDTSGTYQEIGKIRRDMQYILKTCPDNNPPVLSGPFEYEVCAGDQLCFTTKASDQAYVPPPPFTPPPADSTFVTWNKAIPGASFTTSPDTAGQQTATFCWTPDSNNVRSRPYQFTVRAADNACPLNSVTTRNFSITVKPKATATKTITKLENGKYAVQLTPNSATSPVYFRTVSNLSGVPLPSTAAFFKSSGNGLSSVQKDTLTLKRNGTYIMPSTINNPPYNCGSSYFDTLMVDSVFQSLINYPKDTTVCSGSTVQLTTTTSYATGKISYRWFMNDTLLPTDTLASLAYHYAQTNGNKKFTLKVTDAAGHTNQDDVRIKSVGMGDAFPDKKIGCPGSVISIKVDSALSNIKWYNGSTGNSISFISSVNAWVDYTDSFGCPQVDSISIQFLPAPMPSLKDSNTCAPSVVLNPGKFKSYAWSNSSTDSSITVTTSGIYTVTVTDSNGCKSSALASITLWNKPIVNLGADTAVCGNEIAISVPAGNSYLWSNGSTTRGTAITSPGKAWLQVTDGNGCTNADSINVTFWGYPNANLGNDTVHCGSSISYTLTLGNSHLWSNGTSSYFATITTSGKAWVRVFDSHGCLATDTVIISLVTNGNTPTLTRVADHVLSNKSGAHTWYNNIAVIPGQTDSFLVINAPGNYTAVTVDSNGCVSGKSNVISKTLGIDMLISSSLTIYPNPTNGEITIDATSLGNINSVKLYDNLGKQVANTQSINGSLIDLAWEARSGLLWVVVSTDSGLYRQAVVSVR